MPKCDLCGLTTNSPIKDDEIEGSFCCRGCLEVYKITEDKNLKDKEINTNIDEEVLEDIYLSIDGMHCPTCEDFIELTSEKKNGIIDVEVSYTTETAKVVFNSEEKTKKEICNIISNSGYTAQLADEKELEKNKDKSAHLLVGGFFGMMVMVWYILFLYPYYLDVASLVDISGNTGLFLFAYIFIMSSIVVFYTGFPILRGAYISTKAKKPNMDLLIGIAILSAYIYSTISLLSGRTEIYYDISVVVVLVVSTGDYYKNKIKNRAMSLLTNSVDDRISEVRLKNGDKIEFEDLKSQQEVLVKKGEKIPIDGKITKGEGLVDESLVTGESLPVKKQKGDQVIGGSVILKNALTIEADEQKQNTLERIKKIVWETQASSSGKERISDKIARIFVPLVLSLSIFIFAINIFLGYSFTRSILLSLTVLIVSCPCALGLATPLAVTSGIKQCLKNGIIIKDISIFEDSLPDVIAFDKTGTLSKGDMEIIEKCSEDALEKAVAIEEYSSHPIGEAISKSKSSRYKVKKFVEKQNGVTGHIKDEKVAVGNLDFFDELDWEINTSFKELFNKKRKGGYIPVAIGWSQKVQDIIVIGDEPKNKWKEIIKELKKEFRIVLITGDSKESVKEFQTEFDEIYSNIKPEEKAKIINNLEGKTAMVGDGSNDGPALATSDIGIAFDKDAIATDSADIVITRDKLDNIKNIFKLSKKTKKKIKQNLSWAFFYNIIAIPLAAIGYINPLFAALAMSTSSFIVLFNTLKDG